MIELPTKIASERDAEAWKDRLLIAGLCFGGVVTVAWCAILASATWWVVEHIVL